MTNITLKLSDTNLTPTTDEIVLLGKAKYSGDRDIQIFDLGVMAFMIEDILSGYKLPNFITDLGRQKESITITGEFVKGVNGVTNPDTAAWDARQFFMLTSFRYAKCYIEIGSQITKDNISTENSGEDPIYCRVKRYEFETEDEDHDSVGFSLVLWLGKIIRSIIGG